jgi:hypothetical protein
MRSMLLYLVLVGAPLLGLLGILQAGERIVPPRSVGGVWELDAESARRLAAPCLSLAFKKEPAELVVSQSGTHLRLTFADRSRSSLAVTLGGDSLTGELKLSERATCPGATVELRAQVIAGEGHDRMLGSLRRSMCPECPVTQFEAVRRPITLDR